MSDKEGREAIPTKPRQKRRRPKLERLEDTSRTQPNLHTTILLARHTANAALVGADLPIIFMSRPEPQ